MPQGVVFQSFAGLQPNQKSQVTEGDKLDPEMLQLSIEECIQDEWKAFNLAWISLAKEPLAIQALETAVALFARPKCSTSAELNEYRPQLTEELLNEALRVIVKIHSEYAYHWKTGNMRTVSFRNVTVKEYFATDRPLHGL